MNPDASIGRARTSLLKSAVPALLALALLGGLWGSLPDLRTTFLLDAGDDFLGYYAAAWAVRSGASRSLYAEALNGVDPTISTADPATEYAHIAARHGIASPHLYDYPPTLADLLVPLTCLSARQATAAWLLLSLLALAASAWLLGRLLDLHAPLPLLALATAAVLFHPSLDSLVLGQLSPFLLLLAVAALWLYVRGHAAPAALLLALAAALKLTPLVVLVPLLFLRDWKTLRWLALWLALLLLTLAAVNGPATLALYAFHQIPAMSHNLADPANRTLAQPLASLLRALPWIAPAQSAKLLSCAVLLSAGCLCRRPPRIALDRAAAAEALALFLLLSCCLSPVAWPHSYLLGLPALALWSRRLASNAHALPQAGLLVLFVWSLSTHRLALLCAATPLLAAVLAFLGLLSLRAPQAENHAAA